MKEKKWITTATMAISIFIVIGTSTVNSPANATIDINARTNAAAIMNLIDQSLGYYANATGSPYTEREHTPASANLTAPNVTALANTPGEPIVNQADYQIAQGLSDKAQEIFLKTAPLSASNNDPQTILRVLSGLVAFKTAIDNKAPFVEDLMSSPIDRDMERAYQTQ
jgi:hypothetical protein